MTTQPTPIQTASAAANAAHDNIVQLYTLLDILARQRHDDPTPDQAAHLVHNLLNLEANAQALRHALIAAGMIDQLPVQDLLDAMIAIGRTAEHMGDQWQKTGQPPTVQDRYQGNRIVYKTQVERAAAAANGNTNPPEDE